MHRPLGAPVAPQASLCASEVGVADKFWGELLAGSFSIAPQPPTSRPAGWRLAPPSHPPFPLSLAPSRFPPHPHPEARTRHREEPGAGRSPDAAPIPSPVPARAGLGERRRYTVAGNPRQGSLEAAEEGRLPGSVCVRGKPWRAVRPPGTLPGSLQRGPGDSLLAPRLLYLRETWQRKIWISDTCPPMQA